MLVLSRKKNESIVINDDITIVVVEIRGDKVRLGVEAPKEVPVHRREVFDAIHRNETMLRNEESRGLGGAGQISSEKGYLPRAYEILLMPGDSMEPCYRGRLERLYN